MTAAHLTRPNVDWATVVGELAGNGFALVPGLMSLDDCDNVTALYDRNEIYRKTVVMERHRFGLGEYKYFDYPLPDLVQSIREDWFPHLVPVANTWMQQMRLDTRFPESLHEFQAVCRKNGQTKPTPLILKYGTGGHNTMHQDLYGDVFFPIQMAVFLSEPEKDYAGGEFVLTEQRPRAQSTVTVLRPGKGDAVIFTTNFRPVRGTNGYYRAVMKHGVSKVHHGVRHTLGLIFHDALN